MKNESKKTAKKISTKKAESINTFDDYKRSLIEAAESYVVRRLAVEGESVNKAKKREIQAFNFARLTNESFKLLKENGFAADDIKDLRLCFYAKALNQFVNVVNGIAGGEYLSKNNCLAGALIDLKKAAAKALFIKKELSFSCNAAGKTGGANPHSCIIGLIAGLAKLGSYDERIKVIRLNPQTCELLQKMTIESPQFFSKAEESIND